MYPDRVVSGMRPTGVMHLGHFHGALKNWVKLQSPGRCQGMLLSQPSVKTA